MRDLRETTSLLVMLMVQRLDRTTPITRLRSVGFFGSTTLVNGRIVRRPRRPLVRLAVAALGPRRVIEILHETGAIVPRWGEDANKTVFLGWVEASPQDGRDHG